MLLVSPLRPHFSRSRYRGLQPARPADDTNTPVSSPRPPMLTDNPALVRRVLLTVDATLPPRSQ
ncbi:hypothetical protein BD309DRAFT_992352 [Dichomitus squalens]|uniref:Uncharacterized protein n=2 Tax=Dichomitus squalens TaxID=114155 RepID=A0A4Q9NJM6_9APHY|nr:uncharacterized protein DICSQDRAFT_139247 [Dichomitus squalens LYAD-421 SS1]EJF58616.1 hypothetical protein DICSQDRAFT_139247 [Dichomitus squalens LYAD-421 SS1]TBU41499.1 hypothetical protein BD309DRAFT_992352 [Dichomitus squalens]TBU55473.1 hypothetical protein BD310DRAFT_825753 [Dichomitus squalens]